MKKQKKKTRKKEKEKKIGMVEVSCTKGDWPEIELEGEDLTEALWIMDAKSNSESLEG